MYRITAPLLVLFAFACSSNDSAPNNSSPDATGADPNGSIDGETGGENEAPPSIPEPGAVPNTATGIFSLDYLQAGSGDAKFEASAIFMSPPQSLAASQFQDTLTRYEAVPLDTCVSLPVFSVSGSQADPLDAGRLGLTTPSGGQHLIVRNEFAGFVFYGSELPTSEFEPFARYRIESTGATVPAFSGEFWTPGDLRVTAPISSGRLDVERDQPLELAWEGRPDGHPIIVRITQGKTTVTCRVTDNGAFTIPEATLAQFSTSGSTSAGGNDDEKDRLSIERYTFYPLGEGQSATLALTTVGARYEINFK